MNNKSFDLTRHPAIAHTPILSAEAFRRQDGSFDINYSSLLTKLIQEAGRWCRSFASDLFISWEPIHRKLLDGSIESGTYLFGFREHGVDHDTYIKSRYENEAMYGSACHEYRAIWRLDISIAETDCRDKLRMDLYEIRR